LWFASPIHHGQSKNADLKVIKLGSGNLEFAKTYFTAIVICERLETDIEKLWGAPFGESHDHSHDLGSVADASESQWF
jgi:hypothetical protein